MTVDGFGFGTLTGESCLKNVHCHTDRASGRDPRDSCRFWSPHVENVCTVTQIRLGEGGVGGGGIPLGGGGGRRTGIIYGAASPQAPPPPPHGMPPPPPSHASSFQQTVICHPRNCPPKLGLAPCQRGGAGAHGTTRQGTTGAGWGRITHNTGNHRAPSPFPSSWTHRR